MGAEVTGMGTRVGLHGWLIGSFIVVLDGHTQEKARS